MKVMLDTNVLISAIQNPNGVPYKAFVLAAQAPCRIVLCQQIVDEMHTVFQRKFPKCIDALERFLETAQFEVIPMPQSASSEEAKVRDAADRPILRAAISAGIDVLVTGDKDFLLAGIQSPKIMTPVAFAESMTQEIKE